SAYTDPAIHSEFIAHLATGGADGTLSRRFAGVGPAGVVRAKTGTLNSVISLSGYVLGRRPDEAIAFSFLANGVSGKQGAARGAADAVVAEIVRHLHPQ